MKKSFERTLVCNLISGPGAGKSTVASELFAKLKWRGIETELASEFAKDIVWDQSYHHLDDQIWLFGNQYRRINRLLGQVQVVVTDSPLLLSLVYGTKEEKEFHSFVLSVYNRMNNLNFFLRRSREYVESGRMQNKERALRIDNGVAEMLASTKIAHRELLVEPTTTSDKIFEFILQELKDVD